ncbi:MAG TPA: hypothetical protein VG125_18665 [Pirellulales bacterium]|nr:hypothetical protein [Pirellulales bacterium]
MGSLLLVFAALAWCEFMPRFGSPLSSEHDDLLAYGWPLIDSCSEWDWRTNGLSIMRRISDHRHPGAAAVNRVVCVAILFATGLVVEKWLRSPSRVIFRLSTLLKVTAIVACLMAYAVTEDDLAFRVLQRMDKQIDYEPWAGRPQAGLAFKAIALAGLGCVLEVAFSRALKQIVSFCSTKARPFAEQKATMVGDAHPTAR